MSIRAELRLSRDRLGELGRALAGFPKEMRTGRMADTVVVVISEFGRTFRETADHGTDHGTGSVYWVMGAESNGGRILGEQVKMTRQSFSKPGLSVLTDYRAMSRAVPAHVRLERRAFSAFSPASIRPELGLV